MIQTSPEPSEFKCHEHYETPNKTIQCSDTFSIQRDIKPMSYPHFCCMAHEAIYAEDFESEEEDISIPLDKAAVREIFFMDKIPDDIQLELTALRNKHESSSQCNSGPPVSLFQLSSMPVFGQKEDRVITPRYRPGVINHTPMIYLPKEDPESMCMDHNSIQAIFVCKACNKEFTSGQALGGHMSRSHPGFVEEQAKKMRKIELINY